MTKQTKILQTKQETKLQTKKIKKIMEKKFNFIGGVKVMTFAAIASFASVFGFSSCQDDSCMDEACMTQKTQNPSENKGDGVINDSTFVYTNQFTYDGMGVSNAKQYVRDVDFGFGQTNNVRTRGGEVPSIALDLMNQVVNVTLGDAAGGFINPIINEILSQGSGPSTMDMLQTLDSKIDSLNSMVQSLTENLKNAEVTQYYNQRMSRYNGLQLDNCSYFAAYMKHIKSGDKKAAEETLNNWEKKMANGANVAEATYNYMKDITGFRTINGNMCITDVYDYWVFQTTPWEHMGYQKREQLRLGDIAVCTSGYLLACTIYERDYNHGGKEMLENLHNAYQDFVKFYSKHFDFPRHYDKLVCQIKDANIIFDKGIVDVNIEGHTWFPTGRVIRDNFNGCRINEFMYGEEHRNCWDVLNASISSKEATAISNYYASLEEPKSLEQGLKEAGFDFSILKPNCPHVLPLNDGASMIRDSFWNNNHYFKYKKVAVLNDKKPIQSEWTVGVMWVVRDSNGQKFDTAMRDIIKWWDHREHENAQYIHLQSKQSYEGMYPLDKK